MQAKAGEGDRTIKTKMVCLPFLSVVTCLTSMRGQHTDFSHLHSQSICSLASGRAARLSAADRSFPIIFRLLCLMSLFTSSHSIHLLLHVSLHLRWLSYVAICLKLSASSLFSFGPVLSACILLSFSFLYLLTYCCTRLLCIPLDPCLLHHSHFFRVRLGVFTRHYAHQSHRGLQSTNQKTSL